MIIEFDKLYKQYVVWKVDGSCKFEMFKSKLKRDCKKYLNSKIKKG